ncbi:MAG: S9 family peptidase [Saprospiraceae bacterium]|nr:S9 family peptidase [Saprospiraceae bacterium]HMT78436.1 prolyl oligopeptidase family serine peptidase [Saprospiraceae bacterium]HQU96669.1 prolyl oligopeptidase family serine peptidase [Saprospiraceae bacterium]HQW95435.1 prolyl oligopeptidase family serine peptidase [Saprospiraceae bacterium]
MQGQKTPIIDRDLFFGNPEISGGQLSPDGKWISFMKEYKGIMNIWLKKFDEPFEKARPLTDSKRPFYGYYWTEDGKYILYAKDKDGDENLNIFAVSPNEKVAAGKLPKSRNLTPMKDVAAQIYATSKKSPDVLMIGINDRDKAWHDLYRLTISTGKLEMMYENKDRITGYDFDWDDNLRVLYQTDEKGNTQFLYKNGDALTPIYETSVTEQASISGWNEDNSKFYLITNKGELNLTTLYLMDPVTKELTYIESDPKKKVDFGGLSLDRNTRKIISTSYTADKTVYFWRDKTWEENYNFLQQKFPGREVDFQSYTKDYSKFLVAVGGDRYISDSYFFDAKTKKLIFQYTPRPKLKKFEKYLAPMKAVSYPSSDGMLIPGYLTLPVGKGIRNLPTVILVHGGPKGPRDYWGYNSFVQFLANRGYAVLQPNFRASGGYGKAFLNAGDLQWGKLMQDDITWGVKYLIKQGFSDPSKIAIMGGSYGGYATLAGLTFTPDVYACGIDIVGPSNLFTLLESVPAYWESGRAFLYGMTGDPNTEEGKKRIKESSPLFHADKITKPLLIVQGANDPRVKKAEADQIVIALRDKGKDVEYLLADDEGHGFAKPVNNMAMFASIEKFLAGFLGGQYQASMPEDVKKRLGELQVDIKTVTYTPKVDVNSAVSLPEINNTFKVGTGKYDAKLEVQGQTIPMEMTREIFQNGDNYIVADKATSAMGDMKDEITYNSDFQPISRKVEQMGQVVLMNYTDGKIQVDMQGKKLDLDVKGAILNDGPGMDIIVAGLPLEEGYSVIAEMPDMTTMKAKQVKLAVVGTEKINDVNHTKVEITATDNPADKITLWINPNTGDATKMVQVVPAMGNAVITTIKK